MSTSCTISSPGIGKNVLAVGSSSSGGTRYTVTGADGERLTSYASQAADIDTVSYFSSYGPSTDNRIKPELVAPGDMVRGKELRSQANLLVEWLRVTYG